MSEPTATVLADGRLRIVRMLGEGGMGVVYEAFDREHRGPVALKMLRSVTGDAILRLKTEFRVLRDLHHPNLVRLGELFAETRQCYFTMELVDGVDLLDHIWSDRPHSPRRRRARVTSMGGRPAPDDEGWDADTSRLEVLFDEARLRDDLRQVAEGLAALHEHGKVHRDVKPSNVLVDGTGRVVLLDLGLAAELGDVSPHGWIEGTIDYMAPEQASGASAQPPVDLYALGSILYEALVGRPPFLGDAVEVLVGKQNEDAQAPGTLFAGIPPDLDELCCALLRRDPAQRPSARDVADGLASKTGWRRRAPRVEPAVAAAPFVGREPELAELHAAFADSRTRPVMVLVEGESGTGKTALARRFAQGARGVGGLVFAGRCHAQESLPFRAFDGIADAISRYLVATPAEDRELLMPRDVRGLARLFRVFERLAPAEPATSTGLDVRVRRRRAFAALHELLIKLARHRPLILVIDDLQWLDADSLLLFEGIFASAPPPLLLVGMVRDEAAAVREGFAGIPIEIRTVRLGPLSTAEATALAQQLLPARDAATVARIVEASHGSPLFVEQMAAASENQQAFGDSLEQVVWTRISELEPGVPEVLDLVCLAGVALDQASIARAASMQRSQFAGAVAQLASARLVRTTGARRQDLIEPYHDKIRLAVLARLTPEQMRRRHQLLADVLERRNAPPWLVFHHWLAAGDPVRAAPYAVAAAVGAQAELSARRVARLCEITLSVLPEDHEARPTVCRALAVALGNAGQGAEAAHWYLAAAGDRVDLDALELRRLAGEHLLRAGRVDEARAVLDRVLHAVDVSLPTTPRRQLATFLWRRARLKVRGLAAATTPVRDDKVRLRADVCLWTSVTLGVIDFIAGASLHAVGLHEALRLGEPERIAIALATEAGYTAADGHKAAERTHALLARADELARSAGSPLAVGMVTWSRAIASFLEGRYRDCFTFADSASRHFSEHCPGRVWEQASAEMFASWALSHLGELRDLEVRLEELERTARWHDDRYTATACAIGNGVLVPLAADWTEHARGRIDDAMAGWPEHAFHLQHFMALQARTEIDLYLGDGAAAWARLDAAWPALEKSLLLRIEHTRQIALDVRARAALATGHLAEAEDSARRIVRDGVPWAQGFAHARLAAVAGGRGRASEAAATLRTAAEELAGAGFAAHAAAQRLRVVAVERGRLEGSDGWNDLLGRGVKRPDRWLAMYAPWGPTRA